MWTAYYKLVRDKIPAILKAKGLEAKVTIITDDEKYHKALQDKLVEEANEYRASGKPEELVDIYAVMNAIIDFRHIKRGKLAEMGVNKIKEKGGFTRRFFLECIKNEGGDIK